MQPLYGEKEAGRKGDEYRNTRSTVKLGIWILLVGFGGFLLWAAFAPLDEGVPWDRGGRARPWPLCR